MDNMPAFSNTSMMTDAVANGYVPSMDATKQDPLMMNVQEESFTPEDLIVNPDGSINPEANINTNDIESTVSETDKAKKYAQTHSTEGMSRDEVVHQVSQFAKKYSPAYQFDIKTKKDQRQAALWAGIPSMIAGIAVLSSDNATDAEKMQVAGIIMEGNAGLWMEFEGQIKRAEAIPSLKAQGHTDQSIQQWLEDGDDAALGERFFDNPFRDKETSTTEFYFEGDILPDGTKTEVDGEYTTQYGYNVHNGDKEVRGTSIKKAEEKRQHFTKGATLPNGDPVTSTGQYEARYVRDSQGQLTEQWVQVTKEREDRDQWSIREVGGRIKKINSRTGEVVDLGESQSGSDKGIDRSDPTKWTNQQRERQAEFYDAAKKANSNVAKADYFLRGFESNKDELNYGMFGSAEDAINAIFGSQDEVDAFRTQVKQFQTSGALENLPTGSTTEFEYQKALESMPDPYSNPEYFIEWLQNYRKAQEEAYEYYNWATKQYRLNGGSEVNDETGQTLQEQYNSDVKGIGNEGTDTKAEPKGEERTTSSGVTYKIVG